MVNRIFHANTSGDAIHRVKELVSVSSCCKCQVVVSSAGYQISGDSVMGLLMLFNIAKGQMLTVSVDGADEQKVMEKIVTIFDAA